MRRTEGAVANFLTLVGADEEEEHAQGEKQAHDFISGLLQN